MVLRETTFEVGGALTVGLGVLLGVGLFLAGAGIEFFEAWMTVGIAVGLGAFFLYVGRAEGRHRRQELSDLENGLERSPNRRP